MIKPLATRLIRVGTQKNHTNEHQKHVKTNMKKNIYNFTLRKFCYFNHCKAHIYKLGHEISVLIVFLFLFINFKS